MASSNIKIDVPGLLILVHVVDVADEVPFLAKLIVSLVLPQDLLFQHCAWPVVFESLALSPALSVL